MEMGDMKRWEVVNVKVRNRVGARRRERETGLPTASCRCVQSRRSRARPASSWSYRETSWTAPLKGRRRTKGAGKEEEEERDNIQEVEEGEGEEEEKEKEGKEGRRRQEAK